MSRKQVTECLEESGFTPAQVDALMQAFTTHHHSHSIDEVIGLAEQLEEIGEGEEDEDEEDD